MINRKRDCISREVLYPALLCILSGLALVISLTGCAKPSAHILGTPMHHTASGYRNFPLTPPEPLKGIFFNARRVADYFSLPTVPPEHYVKEEDSLSLYNGLERENTLTWLGHSTFLMKLGGKVILTDPFLTDRASPIFIGPRRFVPPGITIKNLPRIDVIMVSHNHADHLDSKTIEQLPRKESIEVIVPLGLKAFFTERGYSRVTELDWHQAASIGNVQFEALPAVHNSGRKMLRRDVNETLWCSWAIRFETIRIFFAGDTAYSPLFKDLERQAGPFDLAMVPIGAYLPEDLLSMSHTNPEEAAALGTDLKTNVMVAMHWGTIQLSDEPPFEPPKRFRDAAEKNGFTSDHVWVMKIGETRKLSFPERMEQPTTRHATETRDDWGRTKARL